MLTVMMILINLLQRVVPQLYTVHGSELLERLTNVSEQSLNLYSLMESIVKAVGYASCIAIPLALGAAIYTGYLIPSTLRRKIKPMIELLVAMTSGIVGMGVLVITIIRATLNRAN